ncbi:MAG: hypothetical protein MZU97_15610 [Bacillus subtilis]|nr:hypothetical protein [Bacillus subtilis]
MLDAERRSRQVQVQDYLIYFYSDSCAALQRNQDTNALRSRRKTSTRIGNVVFFVNTTEITEATAGDRDAFPRARSTRVRFATPMLVVVANGDFYEYSGRFDRRPGLA